MTVLQHHGVFGADAVPPPLVSYFHRPPTENGTSSQKSKHDSRRVITVATTPSADPTADDAVRDREVVRQKGGRVSRPGPVGFLPFLGRVWCPVPLISQEGVHVFRRERNVLNS